MARKNTSNTNPKEWKEMSPGEKTTAVGVIVVVAIVMFWIGSALFGGGQNEESGDQELAAQNSETSIGKTAKSPYGLMVDRIRALISSKEAFDTGSYAEGDIPLGEYAFIPFSGSGKYYSEEDSAGNIIDNENFDSFGYVYVHGTGNIETESLLIKTSAFKMLKVKSAKEVYEILNKVKKYQGAGLYKVGTDIEPGKYTIKSYGEGYFAVMSGPVGNNEIINNDNFNGRRSVEVKIDQYLQVTTGEIE